MLRKVSIAIALLILAASAASGADLPASLWPQEETNLSEIGRGIGVVFTPDLSVPGNCNFYKALGFACFEDVDWARVIDGVQRHNSLYPERAIKMLVLETHGTNGNGLKLQKSYAAKADRSYISVGALQERLESAGLRYIVISACNSGRLLRPRIYRSLDPDPGDKLFGPPTCGIHSASRDFDPSRSPITVVTPAMSRLESTVVGKLSELAPATRKLLAESAKERGVKLPKTFAISDMLMQLLARDPSLQVVTGWWAEDLSRRKVPPARSEANFKSFVARLNAIAKAQGPLPASSPKLAAGRPR
jgi:hypothetical protein